MPEYEYKNGKILAMQLRPHNIQEFSDFILEHKIRRVETEIEEIKEKKFMRVPWGKVPMGDFAYKDIEGFWRVCSEEEFHKKFWLIY